MRGLCRKGDTTLGTTTGEHHGHSIAHPSCTLTGVVQEGSNTVFVNGKPCSFLGARVSESDCCGPGTGTLGSTVTNIFVNGKQVVVVGDPTSPHNGSARVDSGSNTVLYRG